MLNAICLTKHLDILIMSVSKYYGDKYSIELGISLNY